MYNRFQGERNNVYEKIIDKSETSFLHKNLSKSKQSVHSNKKTKNKKDIPRNILYLVLIYVNTVSS